jgi:hypothetical protein
MSKGEQYVDVPAYKGVNKWMNHSGYRIMVGSGRSPFFLNLISQIKTEMGSLVMVVTAKPGKGKTYIALRLAQILDPRFNPREQIVYDTKQMLNAISETSPLKRGQVLLVDEAQFSMSSRSWSDQLQKDLMENLQAVRSKGLIIIIVALGVDLLDIILRKHIINFRLHVEKRGTATVYSYDSHRFTGDEIVKKLGIVKFLLPGWEECQAVPPLSCLKCPYSGLTKGKWRQREKWEEIKFRPCSNLRNRYEIMKKVYVEEQNKASVSNAEAKELKKMPLDKKAMVEYLLGLSTPLVLNSKGNWSDADMKVALSVEFKGQTIGRDTLNELKTMARAQKPEIFKK